MTLFFELLQVSLGTRDSLSRVPSNAEWGLLIEESKRQAVSGVMMSGLERLSEQVVVPEEVMVKWFGRVQKTARRYALHCERARELTAIFESAGFRCSVLKGLGFAQLYPIPARRQLGDIDLWVAGETTEVLRFLRASYPVEKVVWHHADAKIFEDVETEIHYHPGWFYNPFTNRRLQQWYDRNQDEQMAMNAGLGFAWPTTRFNAVHSLVHLLHHLMEEGIGVRHLVDYFYIVRALSADDRVAVVADLNWLGLGRLAGAMMWVLQEVCGMPSSELLCAPNEREGRFLLDEVLRGGNFGHHRHDNRRRNSFARTFALLPHYPSEVLWMFPWKVWHWFWRKRHGAVA